LSEAGDQLLPPSLIDELVHHVQSKRERVETVFIGQAFTLVKLVSGEVGLALTPLKRFDSCIGVSRLAGSLTERNSWELAQLLKSSNAHLRSVGLAAVNAVLQGELKRRIDFREGDFLKFLDISLEDNVAMIDYYSTKIGLLRRGKLTIFDDRYAGKRKDTSILPMFMLKEELPNADIVIFPPTFLEKIDIIVGSALKAREIVLVHPTTPLYPSPSLGEALPWWPL
jgi:uncharacterized protein (DUF4213/DUF364 family)